MFIIYAHLDLSMNALEWNRDLRKSVFEIREMEYGMNDKPDRAKGTVCFPQMREGNIGLCVATLIGRYVKKGSKLPGWNSPEQAWAQTQGQLAWYKAMGKAGEMTLIYDMSSRENHLDLWHTEKKTSLPLGYVLSLEGADSIINLSYLEKSYENGLRAIGPAHYGPGTYAQGTDATGGIGKKGRELLTAMDDLNMILDATHLCDDSFREAMNHFKGPVWASHSNCRTFVNHNRQFTDDQIKELIERGAVIGGALDAWMMVPNWERGISTPKEMNVTMEILIDNMDHICQLAGNSKHVGIGTDLDGAFGKEQCPHDLETISDLQMIPELLKKRGYHQEDINNLMHLNWIRFLREAWK